VQAVVTPQSVMDIAQRVGKRRFRFRSVHSLEDYLTTEDEDQGFVVVINLDNGQYFQLNAEQPRYVLLSSPDEVNYLNGLKSQAAINAAGQNYAKH
jgi:hypothetical protein